MWQFSLWPLKRSILLNKKDYQEVRNYLKLVYSISKIKMKIETQKPQSNNKHTIYKPKLSRR